MNWRDETLPVVNKKTQTQNFIKNELMNYYFYLEKKNEYEEIVRNYEDLQNDPSIGGSLVKMPESQNGLSPQERLALSKVDAENNLRYYQHKLDILDSWMNILTESQHNIVKQYVMINQCRNAGAAGDEIGYREITVKMQTKRAINRIISKMNEFR